MTLWFKSKTPKYVHDDEASAVSPQGLLCHLLQRHDALTSSHTSARCVTFDMYLVVEPVIHNAAPRKFLLSVRADQAGLTCLLMDRRKRWSPGQNRTLRDCLPQVGTVALVLTDEVHTIGEERGATLEVALTRMKAISRATEASETCS